MIASNASKLDSIMFRASAVTSWVILDAPVIAAPRQGSQKLLPGTRHRPILRTPTLCW